MKRRSVLYLSAAAPAVAALTVVGTGVSQAEVSRVSPGPRLLADATPSQAAAAARPRHVTTHRTRPVVHLTCRETDKAAPSSSATTESDRVVCHWSHVRGRLKIGSVELFRSTGGSDSGSTAPLQTLGARTRSFTDTSVTDHTSYTYVLHVMGTDGSQLGTSNTVKVSDGDDEANPGATPSNPGTDRAGRTNATDTATDTATGNIVEPRPSTASGDDVTPEGRTAPHHPVSGGAGPAAQHPGTHRPDAHPSVSRSRRVSTD